MGRMVLNFRLITEEGLYVNSNLRDRQNAAAA